MNEIGRKITNKLIELHGGKDFTIAFLPYKRSMWNSMQSVYEECKASGIDAHCMPIPYYRMKENKQVDKIDSDFKLFGDIAERIEDLEQLHPDYIAIHYQYEDHNKVTNMLPQFFTKALKDKYGAKIIFLPYGIGMGRGHFALQPGCRYIDYAFLEDQDNLERFNAGWQYMGVDFTGRAFTFGSPKLDLIHRDPVPVPDEWLRIIDGRSVTLVANSLGAFLTDPLGRIALYREYITRETEGGRAVIFRPHPLLTQTIKSMMPHITDRYTELIGWMRTQKYLIIDDTEYLEYSFSVADKLISDPSSLLPMWITSGRGYEVLP